MPVLYGYLVPVFFLIGFAAVFRSDRPPVSRELGQLLTISVLGGACFGMPTALVAERERGIWRRYRLLPMATGALVCSSMIARLILVGSSALLQIILAIAIYGMPMPQHPGQLILAFLFVAWAFLGMGLVIAMLADSVPAVQALGQAIFLPMILIGGVGVPLRVLPDWAQILAGFMPGRYAVEALDATIIGNGLNHCLFSLLALLAIGAAGCAIGASIFRWDAGQKLLPKQKLIAALAVVAWAAVGIAAEATGKPLVVAALAAPADFQSVTDAQIDSITYDDLQPDDGFVTPIIWSMDDVAPPIRQWTADFSTKLSAWPPGQAIDLVQRARNLLSACAVADLAEYPREGEVPYVVFSQLKTAYSKEQLIKILAQVILQPKGGTILTSVPELGIADAQDEQAVRDRINQYARKMLGRLLGKR